MNLNNVNKLTPDGRGGWEGILLINKPAGVTSHDIVDNVRRIFKGSKVGHAGALDPFATGLLIILVGKFTSQSDQFLGLPKSYLATILFGVSTNTMDPEGQVTQIKSNLLTAQQVQTAINNFPKQYNQTVPVFSSVKVGGDKLRILARKYADFEVVTALPTSKVLFKNAQGDVVKELNLPPHPVTLYKMELNQVSSGKLEHQYIKNNPDLAATDLSMATVDVSCSKGTYIRSLAQDLAASIDLPGMLVNLERTVVGEFNLDQALSLAQLEQVLAPSASINT